MPADVSSAASYSTATDNLRTATRWLLTAAAAAGAVLVAGLQLTSIGSPGTGDWPRLAAATAGLTAGLGAVGYMIFQASMLLTDEWITLAQLEMEPFRQQLQAGPSTTSYLALIPPPRAGTYCPAYGGKEYDSPASDHKH